MSGEREDIREETVVKVSRWLTVLTVFSNSSKRIERGREKGYQGAEIGGEKG
jgi:hypothetical protein